MKTQIGSSLLLFLTATIWGVAFVAQSAGMEYVGGFTFNCVRSLIGGVVLIPCIFLLRTLRDKDEKTAADATVTDEAGRRAHRRALLRGGICCGIALCIATNLQQFGIKYTTVGKAGFITALYIVLVPLFGLFLHKKVGKKVWIGLVLAVAGLYLLTMKERLAIAPGDLLVLACAVVFAVHILVIDHFSPLVDGVTMSCIQFFVSGFLSAIPMLLFEEVRWESLVGAAVPILYTGVLSSGCAYTFQIIGQKNLNPTLASMIMSLESVISVLAGMLILHQMLTGRELLGCCLMFAAVILSQLPERKPREIESSSKGEGQEI